MRISTGLAVLGCALLIGCSEDSEKASGTDTSVSYQATVRYTEFGVPHIKADDAGSLAYGIGFAHARENLCTLSEQLMKLKSQRSRYLGPGDGYSNLLTDVGYKAIDYPGQAEQYYSDLSSASRIMLEGYAAGFNRVLQDKQGNWPSPCAGAEWVTPVTGKDLLAYQLDLAGLASTRNFLAAIAAATPPSVVRHGMAKHMEVSLDAAQVLTAEGIGSNGWALGKDRVEGANSMLLGNPHFPWDGELRFFQNHLTIPGEMDVNGVTMMGLPAVVIGFNQHLGWTHTVSQSKRFTLYQLKLDSADPTHYLFDGEVRAMTEKSVTVDVLQADGSVQPYSQTVYFSHFGPVVNLASLSPALGWTDSSVITYRDANAGNIRMLDQWLAMSQAKSRDEFLAAFETHQGIPWVNTLMVDESGSATYVDGTQVPQISVPAQGYWETASQSPQLAPIWQDGAGSVLLPGHSSAFEWVDSGDAGAPGLIPFSQAPLQTRQDYLFNANSSHWLGNLSAPLEGFSILYGPEGTIRSPRTRYNAALISDMSGNGLAGMDNRFTLDELKTVLTHNGSLYGGDWKNALTQRCTAYSTVQLDGSAYDLSPACQALVNWDGTYNLNSQGAHLMRELLRQFRVSGHRSLDDALFSVPFDESNPATTPSGLVPVDSGAPEQDPVLVALARASSVLEAAGIALDAPLRDVQYLIKAEDKAAIPVTGGYSFEGVFNMAESKVASRSTSLLANNLIGEAQNDSLLFALDEDNDGNAELAYRPNYGSSFVMALAFTDDGPKADMLLSYSQSHDPDSPHFSDLTQRYSQQQWQAMLLDEEDVEAATVETVDLDSRQ